MSRSKVSFIITLVICLGISIFLGSLILNAIEDYTAKIEKLETQIKELKDEKEVYYNRIVELETQVQDLQKNFDDLSIAELPVTDFTFYAGNEPTSGSIGASGKRLTHNKSIALNKPLMNAYDLEWGDKIIVKSEEHPEINGIYILEDCGVGRNDTADGYVKNTSYIPSWGRATDLKTYAIRV